MYGVRIFLPHPRFGYGKVAGHQRLRFKPTSQRPLRSPLTRTASAAERASVRNSRCISMHLFHSGGKMSSVWFECLPHPQPPPPLVKDRGVYFYPHESMRSNVRAALGRGRRSLQSDTPTVWFNPGQQAAWCASRAPRDQLKIQLTTPFKGSPSTGQSGNGRREKKNKMACCSRNGG